MSDGNPKPAEGSIELPFRAVIAPHRSLSRRGFIVFMLVFGLANFFTGLVFYLKGAWPVIGFAGLDVALLWLAFRLNYRAGRTREIIEIDRDSMTVSAIDWRGRTSIMRFDPFWTRLTRDVDAELGTVTLHVGERGRSREIAAALSPPEKLTLADALGAALRCVRQ